MKNRLFYKLGSVYLGLAVVVLLVVDVFVVRTLRREFLDSAFLQLESLARLATAHPPPVGSESDYSAWTGWLAQSGARVTLIAQDGRVLADSDRNALGMEYPATGPEIASAFAKGAGRAVTHDPALGNDLVNVAVLYAQKGRAPLVIRFSLPLSRLDQAVQGFRIKLWSVSLLILVLTGGASLLFFRTVSTRIERLKDFSRRVAGGDFRLLPIDRKQDELADLTGTLNETAAHLDRTFRSLTEERNQSAAILASMTEGVAVIGVNHRLTFCNEAFRKAVGVENAPWEGRMAVEVIRHSDLLAYIRLALEDKETVRGEFVVGSVRTSSFAVTAAPIQSDGTIAGAVIVLYDISEPRRLERARRDFVANVSHEFKTPLTAIQGFAETLLGGALEDRQNSRRFLEIIRDNSIRLGRLTNDMLKLAQIEAGKLQLESSPVNIGNVIGPCIETTQLKAAAKSLVLATECSPDLPAVIGDLPALTEVLQNLLDNAVRYSSPGGRIAIRAAVAGSEVVISVSDTGIGIPKLEQERIFERFYRADAARSRESGGTGLGLAIAKHLIEAMGGRIQVQSEVGSGSMFSIFMPFTARDPARETHAQGEG